MARVRRALLDYQRRWVYDRSPLKLCEKSRRIGITWATAGEAVTVACLPEHEGGMDVWYMVASEDDAKEFIDDCAAWVRLFDAAAGEVGESMIADDDSSILAFQIRFSSGFKIHALSSVPRRLRGKQGYAILDEAAHHDDLPGFMEAATAFLMLGGRIAVISTHNGDDNPFALMIAEEYASREAGNAPRVSLHRYTLDDALADGFYERIVCLRNRQAVRTDEARAAWRQSVIDYYGDKAPQELFAVPRSASDAVLWRPETLQLHRWSGKVPPLWRTVIALDPSGSDLGIGDECGIVTVGITGGDEPHLYVISDDTHGGLPREWMSVGIERYRKLGCSLMVGEANYGGKMISDLLALLGGGDVEYRDVWARKSKYERAVPVAAMYTQGRVHHVGEFPALERELTTWRPGRPSPNRMDALVHACTELLWPDGDDDRRSIFFM